MIEAAASCFGAGPSLLWLGQGLQRQVTGGNVMRAAGLLPAACGFVGKPGGGIYYLNGGWALGLDDGEMEGEALRRGPARRSEPHGLGRGPRRPRAGAGLDLLEHERRRLGPAPESSEGRLGCARISSPW